MQTGIAFTLPGTWNQGWFCETRCPCSQSPSPQCTRHGSFLRDEDGHFMKRTQVTKYWFQNDSQLDRCRSTEQVEVTAETLAQRNKKKYFPLPLFLRPSLFHLQNWFLKFSVHTSPTALPHLAKQSDRSRSCVCSHWKGVSVRTSSLRDDVAPEL